MQTYLKGIVLSIAFLLFNSVTKSQNVITNDSLVTIPKSVAQNVLKTFDSLDKTKAAYNNLLANYNRQKQLIATKDKAFQSKTKEATICREIVNTQRQQLELWADKSLKQNKEIKKQKALKWIFIITTSLAVGFAATK